MTEEEKPPPDSPEPNGRGGGAPRHEPVEGGPNVVMLLVAFVVGTVLFVGFSFLTFGLPLLVVAIAAVLWCYVGLMRLIDHALNKKN